MADQDGRRGYEEQRRRHLLPSIEDLENQPWDNPETEDADRYARSRIPRPVPSQSIEGSPTGLQVPGGGGRLERAVTDSHIPTNASPERTPVISLERSNTDATRTPRYQYGKFESYEEMLAQMDLEDPFQGEAPPPNPKRERTREKTFMRSHQGKRSPQKEKASDHDTAHRHHKPKSRKPDKIETAKAKDELEGTYTISTHKNPVYSGVNSGFDSSEPQGHSRKKARDTGGAPTGQKASKRVSLKQRPVSATSTGTYTVDLERSDSQSKLINNNHRRETTDQTDGMTTARMEKTRFDCREQHDRDSKDKDPVCVFLTYKIRMIILHGMPTTNLKCAKIYSILSTMKASIIENTCLI